MIRVVVVVLLLLLRDQPSSKMLILSVLSHKKAYVMVRYDGEGGVYRDERKTNISTARQCCQRKSLSANLAIK